MNTEITKKKTPHATCNTIFGSTGVYLVHIWCFENGHKDDPIVKKWVSEAQCYVKPGLQDLPDYQFTASEMRNYHVDVWNQKCRNREKYGKFLTNFELKQFFKEREENKAASEILMNCFK